LSNKQLAAFFRDRAAAQRLRGEGFSFLAEQAAAQLEEADEEQMRQRERLDAHWREEREQAGHDEDMEAQEEVAQRLANIAEILEAPQRAAEAAARRKAGLSQVKTDAVPLLERAVAEAEEADDLKESSAVIIWLNAKQLRSVCNTLEVDELPLDLKVDDLAARARLIAQARLDVPSIEDHVALAIELMEALHAFWHSGLWEWTLWNRNFPCLSVSEIEKQTRNRVSQLETLGRFATRVLKAVAGARGSRIVTDLGGGKLGIAEWFEVILREPDDMPGWEAPSFPIDSFLEALQHFGERSRAASYLDNVVERSRAQMLEVLAEAEHQGILIGAMRWIPVPLVPEWLFRSRRPQFEIEDFKVGLGIPIVWGFVGLIAALFILDYGDLTPRSLTIAFGLSAFLGYFVIRYRRAGKRLRCSLLPVARLICKGLKDTAVDRLLGGLSDGEVAEAAAAAAAPAGITHPTRRVSRRGWVVVALLAAAVTATGLALLNHHRQPDELSTHLPLTPTSGAGTLRSPEGFDPRKATVAELEAHAGQASAESELGARYLTGNGAPKNYAAALEHFRKAGQEGDVRGLTNAAWMLTLGQGSPRNDATAIQFFTEAANQGYPNAEDSLGYMYEHGRGVPIDLDVAVSWYRKAADQGFAKSKANLERLSQQ
jgi:hypothetical protein